MSVPLSVTFGCQSDFIIYLIFFIELHTGVQKQDSLDIFTFQTSAVKVKVTDSKNRKSLSSLYWLYFLPILMKLWWIFRSWTPQTICISGFRTQDQSGTTNGLGLLMLYQPFLVISILCYIKSLSVQENNLGSLWYCLNEEICFDNMSWSKYNLCWSW